MRGLRLAAFPGHSAAPVAAPPRRLFSGAAAPCCSSDERTLAQASLLFACQRGEVTCLPEGTSARPCLIATRWRRFTLLRSYPFREPDSTGEC